MDEYTAGFEAAREAYNSGIDVRTHASQGDTAWDRGWNAFIDTLG